MKSNEFLIIIILVLIVIFTIPSFSPELAVRRNIFLRIHPIDALTIDIRKTNIIDKDYGDLYDVKGFVDRHTMHEMPDFYLKKNIIGWYVYTIGTGSKLK
jgi:hypothetical protein